MSQTPIIEITEYTSNSSLDTNTYQVHIRCNDPLYYYIIKENNNIVAQRYDINNDEYLYEFTYDGHITEDTQVSVEAQSYTFSSFESEIATKSQFVYYYRPFQKIPQPTNFECTIDNSTLTYNFTIPTMSGICGYSIDYITSDSISPFNSGWNSLVEISKADNYTGGENITQTITFGEFENNKYTLFRVYLWSASGDSDLNSDYVYKFFPRHCPYQAYVIDGNKNQPCIARIYKEDKIYQDGQIKHGQWRQCRIHSYELN